MLEEDRNKVTMALRKLEFPWMTKERLNLELASQVYNGDFSMLPSRKLMPLLEALARPREDDMEVEEASDLEVVLAEKTTGESIAAKIELLKEVWLTVNPGTLISTGEVLGGKDCHSPKNDEYPKTQENTLTGRPIKL